MQQFDAGHDIDVIASNLGKSVLSVRQQIARLRKRIEAGHIRPAPLPIKKAAGTSRVYLAGFDVFQIDAVDPGAYPKDLCRAAGYVGIYPFDNEASSNLGPADKAAWICRANIDAIRSADMVMAILNDFRGSTSQTSAQRLKLVSRPRWESLYGRIDSTLERLWNRSLKRPMRPPRTLCARLGTSLKIFA